MRGPWKLVCVTPAGRRRYLRLLVPYVLSCPGLDRYDLWVNTPDPADIAFMEELASIDSRINLVRLAGNTELGPKAIGSFWSQAMDTDTVYIRFDDDVVWIDPYFFDTLLDARVNNEDDFMVAPLTINNALGTYLLQTFGKIQVSRPAGPDRFDPVGWINPSLPLALHGLLQDLINNGEVERLQCGRVPISANCFSINCLSWFGRDIAAFDGVIPVGEDEEAAMSCSIPLRVGRINSIETAAVAAHFAFYTQRLAMDASTLLDEYRAIAGSRTELEPWRSQVEAVYERIEKRFPIHQSLGGFKPSASPRWRRSWIKRLLGVSKQAPVADVLTVVRGPKF